ncbi:MAG: hypothetical protein M1835_003830 [Candelina submexicana]|nr:MAG: hypothetical protein M1835_003830 [Candelina submexicana]
MTIIDYTLSRADLKNLTPGALDMKGAKDVTFYNLEHDPAPFEGDAHVDYQYKIYRLMRTEIFGSSGGSEDTTKDENQDLDSRDTGWRAHYP